MPKVDIPFDTYHDHDAMTAHLRTLVDAFPHLARMTSVAKSFQGRDVWLIEITNPDTGPALEKPGYYIDAQIHAEEHATSATALYAVWYLLENYGHDEQVTRLVDQQVFYILPRINPDGAELSLQPPYYNWCGNGRYMPGADRISGLIPEDIDGDGYLVWMRVPDPSGEWKKSPDNPDIMIQRGPHEHGGEYFRLYPEGTIRDHDGVNVPIEKPFDGNMNRNFPTNWSPQEYGGGIHPLSEPEAKGMAEVILARPNICGMCAYHTHGGIILRPSMTRPDSAMGAADINLYKQIGAVGTEITGYPTVSIYEEFTPDKSKPRRGGLMDWTYEEMGIISFGTELWDLERTAGVDKVGYYNLYPRTPEIQAKVHDWVSRTSAKRGSAPGAPSITRSSGPLRSAAWSTSGATVTRRGTCWKRSATRTCSSTSPMPMPRPGCRSRRSRPRSWPMTCGNCGPRSPTPATCPPTCRTWRWRTRSPSR